MDDEQHADQAQPSRHGGSTVLFVFCRLRVMLHVEDCFVSSQNIVGFRYLFDLVLNTIGRCHHVKGDVTHPDPAKKYILGDVIDIRPGMRVNFENIRHG